MRRRKHIEFSLLVLFSFLFWGSALADTFQLAWSNEACTHTILIIPLSLALIYLESKTRRPVIEPNRLGGPFLLAAAFALGCFARWGAALAPDLRLTLSMFSLVLWWMACVVFCCGWPFFRAFLFPLCFLLWLVPLPDFLLRRIVEALQNGSAVAARWLFQLARVPVTQDGIVLSIPGFDVEVARECSSIRSSLILIITTMILARMFLRSNWRRLILVMVAIPLSVAKNGLRIFMILELAMRVDPGYMNGDLHHHGGIVFLVAALGSIIGLLWLLVRSEVARSE
jgi:exosortase